MKNEFEVAFTEITELRSLPQETVLEALKTALVSAYRRDTNASAAQRVEAHFDSAGRPRILVEKEVVDSVENPNTEVDLETARYYHPEAQIFDTVMVQLEGNIKKFGRIAAQTAKQVILQKIREAERESLYEEFIEKEGDIINGTVQSTNAAVVTISMGRAEAIMPRTQQIPRERYRPHDKIRVYVMEVKRSNRGPQIVVSRSHRNMLRRLLEFEVPEIYNGQIEIKNIAREAGFRSKVAVAALQEGIDPVGACVGMRGIRIQNIVKELHDEKIDVIEWNPKQELFIEKALSPARVTGVYLDDDPDAGRTAVVVVPDDQLSLAIGREGQNARLAAKLTGWRIDIKSVTESVAEAMEHIADDPLVDLTVSHADLVAEVGLILEKKAANRTIMPEEYRTMAQLADLVERKWQAARLEARRARLEEINAVKMTLPTEAFEIPVQKLDLPDHMIESLTPLENVGEIMLRFLIDENRLRRMLGKDADSALVKVQDALDQVMFGDAIDEDAADVMADEVVPETVGDEPETAAVFEAAPDDEAVVSSANAVVESEQLVEEDAVAAATVASPPVGAFPEVEVAEDVQPRKSPARESGQPETVPPAEFEEDDDLSELEDGPRSSKQRSKEKQKRRQLVFDEESGQTIAKRRRKAGRKREEWDDF